MTGRIRISFILTREDERFQTWLDLGERETATGSQPCPGLSAGAIEAEGACVVRAARLLVIDCMGLCHSMGRWAGR